MQSQPRGGFYTIAAWQQADDLVIVIYKITKKFPRHQLYGLTSQFRRSAVSVAANITVTDGILRRGSSTK